MKVSDTKYDVKGEGDNLYKKVADFDPDTDFIAIPKGLYSIQLIPEKKTDKFTQHECVRIWFHALEDEDADILGFTGGDVGKYYIDFFKNGKCLREYDKGLGKYVDNLSVSEHGQYLYAQTLATMTEGKVYAGKFRMEKHAGKYTAIKPLWQVVESDQELLIPSATYSSRGGSGQSRAAAIQDSLNHACRLLNVEKDTDLLEVLTTLYGEVPRALDAMLSLLH